MSITLDDPRYDLYYAHETADRLIGSLDTKRYVSSVSMCRCSYPIRVLLSPVDDRVTQCPHCDVFYWLKKSEDADKPDHVEVWATARKRRDTGQI